MQLEALHGGARGDDLDLVVDEDHGRVLDDHPLRSAVELDAPGAVGSFDDPTPFVARDPVVAQAWRNPDPDLQPFMSEARAALARLSAEPRKSGS